MKDNDAKLLWEAYDSRLDNPHHQKEVKKLKRENPQLPLMRAKAKMDMGIKLTDADRAALMAHGLTEDFEFGGHAGEQRRDSVEKQAYVVADSQGVYGVYTSMQGAAQARTEIGGGSYVVGVSVDVDPQQYGEIEDMDLYPDQLGETREAPKGKHYTKRGALKSGDADADGDGGPKFRSDPTDKPGKGD